MTGRGLEPGRGSGYIGGMKRLLAAALALMLPAAAQAAEVPLAQLSAYLNGLTMAEAEFTQKNADGSTSTGEIYIHRPGRMRFEYAPPNKALVIAGGGSVAVFDPKSNQPPAQYPLGRTPLSLILAPTVDLGEAKMVVDHHAQGADTVVVAEDPQHPDYGTITLVFSDDPVALKAWTVTDGTGAATTVTLSALKPVTALGDRLFDIPAEVSARSGR